MANYALAETYIMFIIIDYLSTYHIVCIFNSHLCSEYHFLTSAFFSIGVLFDIRVHFMYGFYIA